MELGSLFLASFAVAFLSMVVVPHWLEWLGIKFTDKAFIIIPIVSFFATFIFLLIAQEDVVEKALYTGLILVVTTVIIHSINKK